MREMMWQRDGSNDQAYLYYKDETTNGQFVGYKMHPMAKSDYQLGTRGYSTMQVLLSMGYKFIDQSAGIPYDDKL